MAPRNALIDLAARLETRRPDYIVRMSAVVPEIDAAIDAIIAAGSYICVDRPAGEPLRDARNRLDMFYDVSETVTVCRLRPADKDPAAPPAALRRSQTSLLR
jgi:hypothetical protein